MHEKRRRHILLGAALAASTAIAASGSALGAPVTEQRLLNAPFEPQNWLMVYGDYSNHRYSRLSQINRNNVAGMRMAFAVALGGMEKGARDPGQQSTPLVNDGYIYVNNAWNQIRKIDARSGTNGPVVWMADPLTDRAAPNLIASRGITLLDDIVYTSTLDARLVGINAESGEIVIDVPTSAPDDFQNQSHTGAPLAVKNMIMVGQSNGFRGNRGWVGAFSAADGALLWRTFMVPGPGEPGHETWADNHNAWRTGGAAIWTTGSYDPEFNIYVVGTGDPAPWGDPEFRPGDNLYSVSTVALDVDTGEIRWHFQEIPNESWDFDTVNPKVMYNLNVGGETQKFVSNFSRSGFFYTLDRSSGSFVRADQYVDKVTWTAGIDPKTGHPVEYNPNVDLQAYLTSTRRDGVARKTCPDFNGAPTYFPPTYDPVRQIAYVASGVGCFDLSLATPLDVAKDYRGEAMGGWRSVKDARQYGHITGIDVTTGQIATKTITTYPINSGLLSTGGDLVFTGHLDGRFSAYDSDSLAELWSINVGTPIVAPPITYSAEGRQYVAVVAGGPSLLYGNGGNIPELGKVTASSMLFVFGL